jgi:hypothetical protein
LLEPLSVAVTVEVWLEVTAAAVAVKVAVVAVAGTVTEAGTVTTEVALLERATEDPPEGAALDRVTVHVVVVDAARVVLPHTRDVGVAGATSDKLAVALEPFKVALTVAAWSVRKEPAVALKVALVEFAGTETLPGMVMLPVEVNETEVVAATGPLNVTVQTDTAPGASDEGEQETPLTEVVVTTVAVPPSPLPVSSPPSSDAPSAPEIPIEAEEAVDERVTDTVATSPLEMRFVLIPEATQMALAEEVAQSKFLAAAVSAGPGLTARLAIEPAG